MKEIANASSKKNDVKTDNSVVRVNKVESFQSRHSPADRVLHLQRTIGNQAVGRLIESGALQTKLKIGQPGDRYEQEADRMADEVMRIPDPGAASGISPHIQRACPTCEEDEEELQRQSIEEEEEDLQAKPTTSHISKANPNLESNIRSLKGGGKPLSENDRAYFEPRFGHDFSQVRVHTNAKAAEAVNARAFTMGNNVVFGAGQYAPGTSQGQRLMTHELTHVVQQTKGRTSSKDMIRRQQAGGALPTTTPGAQVKAESAPLIPRQDAARVWYREVMLADDKEFMRGELRRLITKKGLKGADKWWRMLLGMKSLTFAPPVPVGHLVGTGASRIRTPIDSMRDNQRKALRQRLTSLVSGVYINEIRPEAIRFIDDFKDQAKANVRATLTKSKDTAMREAVRYGLTEKEIDEFTYLITGSIKTGTKTKHHMQTGTPIATGLQEAADVLLTRRKNIERLMKEQRSATQLVIDPYSVGMPRGRILVPVQPIYSQLGREVQSESEKYNQIRSAITAQYPVLAAVSELDKSISDLKTIAKKGAGDKTAQIIGAQIAKILVNIDKVCANLDDKGKVNIWRLPPIIDATSTQLGAHTDAFKKRIVADKIEHEKPEILGDIELLILNIVAIALAPATGGISLGVAAGVNVVTAGFEIQEYMMKKALVGTDFDKARALSQEDTSLIWLAISIVGTVFDVKGATSAIKTFRTLTPLAKVAEGAESVIEAEIAIEALEKAARREGGEQLAESVITNVRRTRGGESLALEAAGASMAERKALEAATRATKKEAADLIGAAKRSASSNVNISKKGNIFSCTNPCAVFREKYAAALAKDPDLEKELVKLETRALDAAAETKRGSPNANELTEAVKNDAAAFENKIRKAHPDLVPANAIEVPAALKIEQKIAKLAEQEKWSDEFKQIVIAKFGELDKGALTYLADLNLPTLEWLAKLQQPEAVRMLANARIRSPFSLRQLATNIKPKSSIKKIKGEIKKAERHREKLIEAFDPEVDWSKIPGGERSSIGKHLGYEIEEIAKVIASGGRAKKILHYKKINEKVIAELQQDGGRVLITQGQLKGGKLRFDIAEINFDKKTVELIDLAPKASSKHVEKTTIYEKEMRKLLPDDFTFITSEHHYVGIKDKVLEVLEVKNY